MHSYNSEATCIVHVHIPKSLQGTTIHYCLHRAVIATAATQAKQAPVYSAQVVTTSVIEDMGKACMQAEVSLFN